MKKALFLLCCMLPLLGHSQTAILSNGASLQIDACQTPSGTLYDDGGPNGNYSDHFDGYISILASPGVTITLSGDYHLENCCDGISVWDGSPTTGILLADNLCGSGTLSLSATSGQLTLRFHSDGSVADSGFVLTWNTLGLNTLCSLSASDLVVSNITSSSAQLSWDGNAPSYTVFLDGQTIATTTATSYLLTATNSPLASSTRHRVTVSPSSAPHTRCCLATTSFRTACGELQPPLYEDFDDCPLGEMAPCWTRSVNYDEEETRPRVVEGGTGNAATTYTIAHGQSLLLGCGSTSTPGHYGLVLTPRLQNPNPSALWHVGFDALPSHYGTYLELGLCDTSSPEHAGYGFIPLDTLWLDDNSHWTHFSSQIPVPAGVWRLAFRLQRSMQDGDLHVVHLDDIRVEQCGVSDFHAYRTDTTSSILTWNTFGNASATIGIRPSSWAEDSIQISNATSPFTLSGLAPDSYYTITLYSSCSSPYTSSHTIQLHTAATATNLVLYCLDNQNTSNLTFIDVNDQWNDGIAGLFLRHNGEGYGYLITEQLNGLAGKEVLLHFCGYYSNVFVGTMDYQDDTTSFVPLDSFFTDYYRNRYIHFTVPANSNASYLAVRFTSELNLYCLQAGTCLLDSLRVLHRRGTSIVLGWATMGATDTVRVEYGPEGFEPGTGQVRFFVGAKRGTINGLNPSSCYDFIVTRTCAQGICRSSTLREWTRSRDFDLPFCEDFEESNISEEEWNPREGIVFYPNMGEEHVLYEANRSLRLASGGYDGQWLSSVEIPEVEIDTDFVLSFHATSFADSGRIELGYYNDHEWIRLDTIALQGGGLRRHYALSVVATDAVLDHRLALRFIHRNEGHLARCFIDELAISTTTWGAFSVVNVGYDTATIMLTAGSGLPAPDNIEVMLVGGGDTIRRLLHWSSPLEAGVGGLDTGTFYRCYVKETNGCYSLAGVFSTYGIGGGNATCFSFDDLLSYELPAGWDFVGTASVTDGVLEIDSVAMLPPMGDIAGTALLVRAAGDTLLVGSGTLGGGVQYSITDTIPLASTFSDTAFTLPTPMGERLCLAARGDCRITMVGLSPCPIVDFHAEGSTLVCSLRNGGENYMVHATDTSTGNEYAIPISSNPYRINTLPAPATYNITYDCYNGAIACIPTKTINLTDSISLPYCEAFDPEGLNDGVPTSWRFIYSGEGEAPNLDLGWGESPLRMGSDWMWDRTQYAVLPPIAWNGYMTVKARVHVWSGRAMEIGTMASATDTASFIPLARSAEGDGWREVAVGIDSLQGRRVALRSWGGNVYLDRVSISTMPLVEIALVDSRTLELTANRADPYYVRYRDDYGFDTLLRVDTTVYHITTEEWLNDIYVTPMPDSSGFFCGEENPRWQLSERMSLPYCEQYFWDWFFRTHCREHCSGWHDNNGNPCYAFHTCNHGGAVEYMLLPDLDADSIQEVSISFDLKSDYAYDMLEVGVMRNAYDTNTFVVTDTILYEDGQREWHRYQTGFSNYSGTGRWVAFRHRGGGCATCDDGNLLLMDNLVATDCGAAAASATLYRYNEVKIETPENAPSDGYYVEYGPKGFGQGEGTVMRITTNPTLLTLTPDRDYDFYFRCDSAGQTCQTPYRVHTLAAPVLPPVCFGFEDVGVDTLPPSWQQATFNRQRSAVASQPTAFGGQHSLCVGERVVMPDILVDSLQEVSMGLWVRAEHAGDRLIVGTMLDPADPITFTRMATIAPEQTGVWEHHWVSFEAAPKNAHFIAFRHTNAITTTLQNTLFVDDISLNTCGAFDMKVTKVEDGEVTLGWSHVGTSTVTVTVLEDGTTPVGTFNPPAPPFAIGNLTPQHGYTFIFSSSCSGGTSSCDVAVHDTATIITPKPGAGCVNHTDLASPNATFYSGTFANPYSREGAIDFGSRSGDSRHTVCYDTTERDPRTGGGLRTVPEGSTSSVRLGNWNTDMYRPEAEGVIYSLFVDTLSFNLLIMRYAAVLQDPMHAAEDQPRFRLELLDSNFTLIDPVCAAADFIADRSLGWNEAADNVLWKDWTTFGIDLSNYANQLVYIRLTTYDCNEGSHYGYAYFNLECMRRTMVTESCGDVTNNTFTAPAGFYYRWYNEDAPSVTLGTGQTLTIPATNTTYHCDITSKENASCAFTLSAYAGTRYPMAQFDTAVTIKDCGFLVRFDNTSTISPDGINPVADGEPCESALWDYGNGETSTNYHGQTFYDTPGTYTVTLVSGIAYGECRDTAVMLLTLAFPPNNPRIEGPTDICFGEIDSLVLRDAVTADTIWQQRAGYQYFPLSPIDNQLQTFNYQLSVSDPFGCASTVNHTVTVHPVYHSEDSILLCTPLLPFSYADTIFMPGTTHAEYSLALLSAAGCDSSFHLWLDVNDASLGAVYDTADASICDNESYTFFGNNYTIEGRYTTVHVNSEGLCDSIHTLQLEVRATSTADTSAFICDSIFWHGNNYSVSAEPTYVTTNSVGCDSTTTLHLTVRYSSDTTIHHTVVENDLPYLWNGLSFNNDTSNCHLILPNSVGCDSNITFNLNVYRNVATTDSRTLCEGLLPILWNGVLFQLADIDSTSTITHNVMLATSHGADSLVTMILHVLRNSTATIRDTLWQNDLGAYTPPLPLTVEYNEQPGDPALVTLADTTMILTNAAGCDSTVGYTLFLWRNYHVNDTVHRCDNALPWVWEGVSLAADSVVTKTLTSAHGTDSVVTLHFVVMPTYEVTDSIFICPHQPYLYEGVDYGGPTAFDSPHLSVADCDSMVHVVLLPRDPNFHLSPLASLDSLHWFNYDTTLLACLSPTLRLADNSTSLSRTWTFWNANTSDTIMGSDSLFTTTVDSIGTFSFQLIAISPEGCHDTVRRDSMLWTFANPHADFIWAPDHISIHSPELQLYNRSTPDTCSYLWLFPNDPGASSSDSSFDVDPHYLWEVNTDPGEYPVSLIAYLSHYLTLDTAHLTLVCTDTATYPILIVNTYLQFPNSVTPNGDGVNDRWVIVNLLEMGEYSMNELWIYDRWGSLVYHVKNIHQESDFWDPDATRSPDGTYYYRFSAKNNFGLVKRNGVIEVSR